MTQGYFKNGKVMIFVAILKMISTCHPTKAGNNATLKKCIDYALNPKKTQNGYYTGALNCNLETALNDMIQTKQFYGKDSNNKKSRTGYHWTISWSPEEHVDYDAAMDVARKFCDEVLKDYECVYSVHTDQAHTHCHIVFNSVNYTNGKKFRYEDGDWAKMFQPELDKLCKEKGLHTLEEDTGMSNEEYYKEQSQSKNSNTKRKSNHNNSGYKMEDAKEKSYYKRRGNNKYYNEKTAEYTKSEFIKKDVDDAILSSYSLDEFYRLLEEWGYKIRFGKSEKYGEYFALSGRGMERARRNYALGKGYSIESIKKRIDIKNNPLPQYNSVIVKQDMRKYIVRYVYWKKPKKNDTSILGKKMYVLMYKKGKLDKYRGQRPNYYEVKNSLKKIREYEHNIELINQYHIGDAESADAALSEIEKKVSELDTDRKDVYVKRMPYKSLLKAYKDMKKTEMGFYAYKNGAEEYKEQHDQYIESKEILEKYGFDENDIEKYQEEIKAELKSISYEKRQLKKEIKSINNIKNIFAKDDLSIDDVEHEYNNIPDPDSYQQEYEEEQKKEEKQTQKEHQRTL